MPRLKAEVIKIRLDFAQSVNWDHIACSKEWRISRYNAKHFIEVYVPVFGDNAAKVQPEYENQWILDLQVLARDEYCRKYKIGLMGYYQRIYRAEKKTGEKLATPKIRAKWEKDYWEKLG